MLKRITLSLVTLLIGAMQLYATQVPLEEAATIAKDVFARNAKTATKSLKDVRVVSKFVQQTADAPNYYIFNLQPTGFVIISADDRYNPILAFSDESHIDFDNETVNIGLMGTLSRHEQRIEYLRKNNIKAPAAVQTEWKKLRSGSATRSSRSNVQVGPLTTTTWDQGELYNAICPADETTAANGPDGRTFCGCVPIAMAQLIKYHNYPVQGNGSNEYEDNNFGTQSADFCNTVYNWDNMPDALTEPNADVSNLIYQMGVASFTQYSTVYTETYFSYVRDAYVNFFGYDQAANWFFDGNTFDQFAVVAKQDLDRGMPLLLTGNTANLVGHTWVTDGYGYFSDSDKAEYFHFNWGWGGSNNGWFLDSGESWLPLDGQGDDVNEITFYWDRWVLHNLFPAEETCQTPPMSELSVSGVANGYAWLSLQNFYLDQEISFRYRESGTTEWITTDQIEEKNFLLSNLKTGTQYEYQGRRMCCGAGWSNYTGTQTFVTDGQRISSPDPTEETDPEQGPDPSEATCDVTPTSGLTTSSISDNNAYLYTTQPFGQVNNQFRYRPVGTTDWTTSNISTTYYRYLSGLLAGTQYEFQVRQECSADVWSDYSASQTFTTTGTAVNGGENTSDSDITDNASSDDNAPSNEETNNSNDIGDTNADCDANINGNDLYTSSISESAAYVYTPQPNGAVNNQFRYRATGTSTWNLTNIATTYFRYLSGLAAGTTYEYQVNQQCEDGTYSDYSTSSTFTTTGTPANGGGISDGGSDGGSDIADTNVEESNSVAESNADATCDLTISGASLYTSSLNGSAGYVYTPQPLGAVNNQFRYRETGTSAWSYTNVATTYFRYLTGLAAGTTYEFQVQQECSDLDWSEFSESATFTTTSSLQSDGPASKPYAYATFRKLSVEQAPTKIQISPNPVQSVFEFSANQDFGIGATLQIYNTQGKQLQSIALPAGQQRQQVAIDGLNAGIYLVQYQTATTSQTLKFIKR